MKHQIGAREQSIEKQFYRLDLEQEGVLNNRYIKTAFDSKPKGVFQVLFPFPCDHFCIEYCLDFSFTDVLVRWLPATQRPIIYPALIIVDELWEAKVPDYTIDVLLRDFWYKRIYAIRLKLVIGIKNFQVVMVDRELAAWEELQLSRVSDDMTPHAFSVEIESVSQSPSSAFLPPLLFIRCVPCVFLWSSPRLCLQPGQPYAPAPIRHSGSSGNSSPRH